VTTLAPEAIGGAELIGARPYAEIIWKACSIFPDEATLRNIDRRRDILDEDGDDGTLTTFLGEFDSEFFDLMDATPEHNLDEIYLGLYINEHPEEFFR
jgi:hypothetical protein